MPSDRDNPLSRFFPALVVRPVLTPADRVLLEQARADLAIIARHFRATGQPAFEAEAALRDADRILAADDSAPQEGRPAND